MSEQKGYGGKFTVESVRTCVRKKVNINPNYEDPTVKVKISRDENKKFACCMCGTEFPKQKNNFVTGGKSILWKGNGGYTPFCKACVATLMESLTSFYSGNEEHALKHICFLFDWYYNEAASTMTLMQAHHGNSRAVLYPSKSNTAQVARLGSTFIDTIRQDAEEGAKITEVEDSIAADEDEEEFIVTRAMLRRWGKGFTPDQYHFLEEEYADWISKHVCNDKAQEQIYQNLALAQLNIRIAIEKNGKVNEAQKALQELMNSASILPRQTAENVLADTQTFSTLLEKYEQTRPIPKPDPEWKDVDGIRKYTNTWFRGGLAKALKIKNDNTKLYNEAVREMEKYTAHKNNTKNSADGMGSKIFDTPEGKGDKNGDD